MSEDLAVTGLAERQSAEGYTFWQLKKLNTHF